MTPWSVACQASLSFTVSLSLLKLMAIKSVMPSNHLIFCCLLLLLPLIVPSIPWKSEVLVTQPCLTLCKPMDCSPPGSCPWDSPDKNTGVGCHFLLQGIFLNQVLNLGLLHFRQILYHLSHQGSLVLRCCLLNVPSAGGGEVEQALLWFCYKDTSLRVSLVVQ